MGQLQKISELIQSGEVLDARCEISLILQRRFNTTKLSSSADPQRVMNEFHEIVWLILFDLSGRNVFHVPSQLIDAFDRTMYPDDMEVCPPYDAFTVESDKVLLKVAKDISELSNRQWIIYGEIGDNAGISIQWRQGQGVINDGSLAGQIHRIFASFCLWLSSPDSEIGTHDPDQLTQFSSQLRKAQNSSSSARRERVLRRATALRAYRSNDCEPSFGERSAESDRAEHWVRGHWRLQWYGSGASRTQIPKWVRPHRRCIGNGEIADERVYEA